MKFTLVPLVALLAGSVSAAEMRACSRTNMNGSCAVKTSFGKSTGSWNSYNWRSSTNMCVKICRGCTELGWRCQDYSNSNISFNKFIIFHYQNGEGEGSTSCC